MKPPFIEFWHSYVPQKQYHNRYLACQKLWESMDETACRKILDELQRDSAEHRQHDKNPYFYLIDWEPAQPHWLTPKEVGYLLAQHVVLAVCRNPVTNTYGTVTQKEASEYQLEVHHTMK